MLITVILIPTVKNNDEYCCTGWNGTPAIISPELNINILFEMHFFMMYNEKEIANNAAAALQRYTA